LYCGGKPIFADILEDTVSIDPFEIKKSITRKTRAVIPVDFAGHPAELEDIKKIASKYNLTVIEDAAHALGAEYKDSKIGSCKYSDMTILSFHAVKHITTGEGGMVLTNRKDFYDKLIMFRSHGITRDSRMLKDKNKGKWFYEMQFLGFNYRITDIQCALGLSQFNKLGCFVKRRREIAQFYKREFSTINNIVCLNERKYAMSSWHIFPIRVKRHRDKIFNYLRSQNIDVNLHYIPVYLHPHYRNLGYRKSLCPVAERYYEQALTLPLYPKMSDSDVKKVVRFVRSAINIS
jgi:dTDP-4-amino-4,6-dideoxygalactose transaminase